MIAVKAYYNGSAFIPLEKKVFKSGQQAMIVVDDLYPTENKSKSCRGIASEFANPDLIEKESEIASFAFSGADV